jgi:hypothetical protein
MGKEAALLGKTEKSRTERGQQSSVSCGCSLDCVQANPRIVISRPTARSASSERKPSGCGVPLPWPESELSFPFLRATKFSSRDSAGAGSRAASVSVEIAFLPVSHGRARGAFAQAIEHKPRH